MAGQPIGKALEPAAQGRVEAIVRDEGRRRGAQQTGCIAHAEVQPGKVRQAGFLDRAVIAPVLEFVREQPVPFLATEGLDGIDDDGFHQSATATAGADSGMVTNCVAATWLKKRVVRSMTRLRSWSTVIMW